MGAIWFMAALIMLGALDIGNVFWQKRELQKIADLAALAGAQTALGTQTAVSTSCPALQQADATANAGLNGLKAGDTMALSCGSWNPRDSRGAVDPAAMPPRYFRAGIGERLNAVNVRISRTVPYLFVFNPAGNGSAPTSRTVVAEATATRTSPMAELTVRNTLVTVDSTNSPLLNAVIGGLLGGSLALDAAGWNGLLNNQINLLDYLDQLGANLNVGAGQYDQVLATGATAGQLIQAAVDVMQRGGSTAAASVTALQAIQVTANSASASPLIKLGDMLGVQTGTSAAGLGAQLQLFQLVQGVVQLANGQNAAVASVPLSVPGLVNSQVRVQVIEPSQFSALGNPLMAKTSPQGDDEIFVRTAQVRTMASVDLSGVAGKVTDIGNAVLTALAPLTTAVDSVLNLQLKTAVETLVASVACGLPFTSACPESRSVYTTALSARVDVSLEVGNASAYVNDFNCNSSSAKSLASQAYMPIAELRVGKITNPFASKSRPTVDPVDLVEVGYITGKPASCVASVICLGWQWKQANGSFSANKATAAKTVIAGIGASIGSSASSVGQSVTLNHEAAPEENLPELGVPFTAADASYKRMSSTDLVAQVGTTLGSADIKLYNSGASGLLGTVMNVASSALTGMISSLQSLVQSALAPLLDPLLNRVLQALGIDLNDVEIGARLSCNSSVELVY